MKFMIYVELKKHLYNHKKRLIREENIIATTRLITLHKNRGKSVTQCLADRTDYIKNPDKTNDLRIRV